MARTRRPGGPGPAAGAGPPRFYPVFLDLSGKRCVVIGGGAMAQRRATVLGSHGGDVTVIAPNASPGLRRAARQSRLRVVARRFRAGDLRGAWLVCAATDDETLNARVFQEAGRRRIFVNTVDRLVHCSYIVPAVVKRGDLSIAISTGGASPAMAKRVRRRLEALIGPEYGRALRVLRGVRGMARRRLNGFETRRRYFETLIDGGLIGLVRGGQEQAARRRALRLLDQFAAESGRPR